ncbi:AtpZ/AtpI family protein [Konateibacter massiliensis]|uniref:AtpZ/AtpI family protein n=1 Tax=Konateibacter massiliensis TaxID=2002841 RepID=UPI000C162377|nr:AtpZ/AtpI family protein [Konateibacter massiliensis]
MKDRKNVYKTFALITQLGISMLTPIFLCVYAAVFLEEKFSVPVFIPMLILGILAGGRNTYILAKSVIDDDKE